MGNFRLVKKRLIIQFAASILTEMLKNESWDNIIKHNDVNDSLNLFQNTFLKLFLNHAFLCNMQLTLFPITTGLHQESKYLVSATSFLTL